jgi:hypothetical protein
VSTAPLPAFVTAPASLLAPQAALALDDDDTRLRRKERGHRGRLIRSLSRQRSFLSCRRACDAPRRYRAIERVEVAPRWSIRRATIRTELGRGLCAAAWWIENQAGRDETVATSAVADLARIVGIRATRIVGSACPTPQRRSDNHRQRRCCSTIHPHYAGAERDSGHRNTTNSGAAIMRLGGRLPIGLEI